MYPSLLPGLPDEFHKSPELLTAQLQLLVCGSASYREDRKQTPALKAKGYKVFLELLQGIVIQVVYAGYYIKFDAWHFCQNLHCAGGMAETVGNTTHPVVVLLKPVEADGEGVDACLQESVYHPGAHQAAVGDHSPWEFQVIYLPAALEDILSHKGFSA